MNIMYKHIYLNFGVISFMNKELVTFIQLHTYKFGLVCKSRFGFTVHHKVLVCLVLVLLLDLDDFVNLYFAFHSV